MRAIFLAAAFALVPLAGRATASPIVPIKLPNLDPIFSQESFPVGIHEVDIRWLGWGEPNRDLDNEEFAELTRIDSLKNLAALGALAPRESPVVTVFFVSEITDCAGRPVTAFASACALLEGDPNGVFGGHVIAVSEAATEDITLGALGIMIAHELGHSLGLGHINEMDNLMDTLSVTAGWSGLNEQQALTILNSPLIQEATNGTFYIELQPIEFIPEPSVVVLWTCGSVALGLHVKRRRRIGGSSDDRR